MRLLSVNVAQPRLHTVGSKPERTGIYKVPQRGSVVVSELGLAADFVGDVEHHGGRDQAVYVYASSDYDVWAEKLGEVLEPGTFGENLTFSDFGADEVRIGDRFQIGEVLLEVTCPRIPCDTLAARMNDLAFVKKFREARRPGFYARVLTPGTVEAGQPVEKIAASEPWPTIRFAFDLWFDKSPSEEDLRLMLASPLAERGREGYEYLLAQRAEAVRP